MLKLPAIASAYDCLFSLRAIGPFLRRRFSSAPPSTPLPSADGHAVVDHLVKSLGFSRSEALSTFAKLSPQKLKSTDNLNSVVHFLKQVGFENGHIRNIARSSPRIIFMNLERKIKPRVRAFQELIGLSGSDLVQVICNNPIILSRKVDTTIVPVLALLKSVLVSDENVALFLKRRLRLSTMACYVRANVELLRSFGISDERIKRFLLQSSKALTRRPDRLEAAMLRVEQEWGIPRHSGMFLYALQVITAFSSGNLKSKLGIFKSFGWSDSDIEKIVRKMPTCLSLSEPKIKAMLNYFMKEQGCSPAFLASHPALLKYDLKGRVLPRVDVLRVLREKGFIVADVNLYYAMSMSNSQFFKRFMLKYKDKSPEIHKLYPSKGISYKAIESE